MKPPRSRHSAPTRRRSRHPARSRHRAATLVSLGVAVAMAGAALSFHSGEHLAATLSSDNVPLLGSSVSSTAQLKQNTAEFGPMPIVRIYYRGLPPANAWTTGLPAASKSAVVVSFNATPGAIMSGADDAALSHFFDTAPRGHPIYYSYVHEPEHEIVHGEFTAAAYRAAWPHVVALADRAHNPDLHSILILEEFDLRPAAHRDWKDYMPGGGIISTLGWDAYPGGHRPRPPADFMAPAVAASKSAGLPFGFAEFGLSVATGRAAWLSQVGSFLMNSGALFASLFDSANVHPSFKVTDPASISVWRGFVHASAVANDDSGGSGSGGGSGAGGGSGGGDPSPMPPPVAHPSPSPAITGLALSPSRATVSATGYTSVSFGLNQAADVTICVIARGGAVVRKLARPGQPAGHVRVRFRDAGLSGHAGKYKILIVASNAHGSAVAERTFAVTRS
jgi:hypothetical protein